MNSFELFSQSLARNEDKPALISGIGESRRLLTYAELNRHVDRAATAMVQTGLQADDRVLLAVPVSIETYIVMLALLKAGMEIMFIDPAHGAGRVASILRAWPPRAIVTSKALLLFRFLVPELRNIPLKFVVGGRSRGADELRFDVDTGEVFNMAERAPADSALLTFTSGSTGEPKPIVRAHSFLKQQLRALDPVACFENDDIDLVAMPMFVLLNLANGITSVIPACDMKHPGRANPRVIYSQLEAEGATRMVASPALLERLTRYCVKRGHSLPHLRSVSTGGGPVSPSLPAQVKGVSPGATVRMVYGSTEAEPIACVDDDQVSVTAARDMRSGAGLLVGRPVAGCDVRIVASRPNIPLGPFSDRDFGNLCLPDGEIGEIVVAGKHVLRGYADSKKNAETKIRVDGSTWHRTGDAGYVDHSGRLWLVGRCSAAIEDARGSVYPFQVEYALAGTTGVRRAALVSRNGKRVLVLETAGRELRSDCSYAAACIARHGIDSIVTLRRIPVDRRHGAKVDYPALYRVLDGWWARFRLNLVEVISATFRFCRSYCQSGLAAAKVGGWLLKTR